VRGETKKLLVKRGSYKVGKERKRLKVGRKRRNRYRLLNKEGLSYTTLEYIRM